MSVRTRAHPRVWVSGEFRCSGGSELGHKCGFGVFFPLEKRALFFSMRVFLRFLAFFSPDVYFSMGHQ